MEVKQIEIKHHKLGDIVINTSVSDDMNNSIGTIVRDFSKEPCFYHAHVYKNEDGSFDIQQLRLIKPDTVNIGSMKMSWGSKNYITVIKNMYTDNEDFTVYPSGVLSVVYKP